MTASGSDGSRSKKSPAIKPTRSGSGGQASLRILCPHCGDPRGDPMERLARSQKMKYILWGSRKYGCNRCGRVYIRFIGKLFRRW